MASFNYYFLSTIAITVLIKRIVERLRKAKIVILKNRLQTNFQCKLWF